MSSFVVISGLSGAGRSSAADNLEDLGWFVMDNLPPALIPKVAELAGASGAGGDRLALVVGTGRYHDEIVSTMGELRAEIPGLSILFLDASTEALVRRYESTRRRHPFAEAANLADTADPADLADTANLAEAVEASETLTLAAAIEAERVALAPVRAVADVVVDTTELNVHQLRDRVVELFGEGGERTMQVTVLSFGYSHGIPLDVDIVIDCRFLPNPHWVEGLRLLTGQDRAVAEYVMAQPVTAGFLDRIEGLLKLLLPEFVREGKSYLSVAFGCTGGRHRSVAVAEHIAAMLGGLGYDPAVNHRDIGA